MYVDICHAVSFFYKNKPEYCCPMLMINKTENTSCTHSRFSSIKLSSTWCELIGLFIVFCYSLHPVFCYDEKAVLLSLSCYIHGVHGMRFSASSLGLSHK